MIFMSYNKMELKIIGMNGDTQFFTNGAQTFP